MNKITLEKIEAHFTEWLKHIYKHSCKLSFATGSYNKVHEIARNKLLEEQPKIVIGLRETLDQLNDKDKVFLKLAHPDVMKVNK